ncbi:MAG: hypothetical protein U5S82_09115 [Gammaproteobacteria bacterium]|nr:hypothetical protein [Gammaproteobacteria bacterium]
MVLLIILVVATSAVILARFDPSIHQRARETQTSEALARAKELLMGWAVSSNRKPGELPYPDRDNNDGNYDGEADCFTGDANIGLLMGRFPWRGEAGCTGSLIIHDGQDITDGYGARLWYAVSQNLVRNPGPGAAPLNSNLVDLDPPPFPWLQVRDGEGNIVSDRVAAVIIAPGPALEGQDRSGATPPIDEFLETFDQAGDTVGNIDNDGCPDVAAGCADSLGEDFYIHQSDEFNDRLIYITIDELMPRVEKRVAELVASALRNYQNGYGRFPWLAEFREPLALEPRIQGTAGNTSAGNTLKDSSYDFVAVGVQGGDLVHNVTDGSLGVVDTVGIPDNQTLTVGALSGGVGNTFAGSDFYQILLRGRPVAANATIEGTADTGTAGDELKETASNLVELAIPPGSVLENLTGGGASLASRVSFSAGTSTVEIVGDIGLTVGNKYRFRASYGRADAGSAGDTLVDDEVDFADLRVQQEDPIINHSDGSLGLVATVTLPNQLIVRHLLGGTSDAFAPGDGWELGRQFSVEGTRFGLLPVHAVGRPYISAFTLDWNVTGGILELCSGAATLTLERQHTFQLKDAVESGSRSFPPGACQWTHPRGVYCETVETITPFSLTVTADEESPSGCTVAGTFTDVGEVTERTYRLWLRFNGSEFVVEPSGDIRTRSVCIGYDPVSPFCVSGTEADVTLDGQVEGQLTVQDYAGASEVGRGEWTISGTSTGWSGWMRVSGLRLDFMPQTELVNEDIDGDGDVDEQDVVDLPPWFFQQGWERLVAVAISDDEDPDGAGNCAGAGNCLNLVDESGTVIRNDVEALVLVAGQAQASVGPGPFPQDRAQGIQCSAANTVDCYLEGENADTDDEFFWFGVDHDGLNDVMRIVTP